MNIIVVDDESTALHLFLDEAVRSDHSIDFHYFKDDPTAILSYCRENEVDGAILDVRMPHISGLKLAKMILEIRPKIKILFLTGTSLTLEQIDADLRPSILGVAYKPLTGTDLGVFIDRFKQQKAKMKVQMFGGFDCFMYGRPIHFSSSKSKELLAFLIVMQGKNVTMERAITALWADKDLDKAKILYRDAVWRLRSTLEGVRCPCVNFGRAMLSVNVEDIQCDYYDLLNKKKGTFSGPFLPSYEWSMDYEDEVESLREEMKMG